MYLILRCSSVHVNSTFFRAKKLKCTCVINLHELFFRFVFVFIPLPHIYICSWLLCTVILHIGYNYTCVMHDALYSQKKIASTFLRLFNLLTVHFLVVYCAEVIWFQIDDFYVHFFLSLSFFMCWIFVTWKCIFF